MIKIVDDRYVQRIGPKPKYTQAQMKKLGLQVCRACGEIKPRVDFPERGITQRSRVCNTCTQWYSEALNIARTREDN